MSEHTETPWKISDVILTRIIDEDNNSVAEGLSADYNNPNGRANAEFIVKACNMHDELVEACRKARYWLEKFSEDFPIWKEIPAADIATILHEAIIKAKAEVS